MKIHINSVYGKEMKLRVRSAKMAAILFFYNALLAVIGLFALNLISQGARRLGNFDYSSILNVYMIMAIIEFGLVLFIIPAFTAGAISGERERQTLDILLTTKLWPIQIIAGKLLSSISTVLLLVISSMPVLSIVFTIGGIGLADMFQLVFLTVVTAVFIGSIGILFSTIFKRTVPSTVVTYGTVLLLSLGTVMILGIMILILQSRISGTEVDAGNAVLILLLNPVITLIAMMADQYGGNNLLSNIVTRFGRPDNYVINNWVWISAGVQLMLAVIMILLASWLLNPVKKDLRLKK